jgi:hypothetical protein
VPFQPELGMGAIGEDGVRVINPQIVHAAPGIGQRARGGPGAGAGCGASPRCALPGPVAAPAAGWAGRRGGRRRHRHWVHARAACQIARAQGRRG